MSSFEAGTAFVRVIPDTRQFQALLQKELQAQRVQFQAPAAVSGAATAQLTQQSAAATAAAAGMGDLAGATTIAEGATAKEAAASLALTRALAAQSKAEAALAAAIANKASAQRIAELTTRSEIASQAVQVASLRKVEAGVGSVATRNAVLQGSIVGLSRITPVAVFGLGVWGSAAIAAGLATKSAITAAADFEQQLDTFQAVSGATAAEMDQVAAAARRLGADASIPGASALDAANGLTELAKAGLSVQDSIDAIPGVLRLAAAGGIDVGTASQLAATELNAFQLAGNQATRVAELLADASQSAQGDITDFGAAFQQVSAVAHQVGLSLEDTTALLTQLAKAGLQGADGGTSLRTTLLRLVPTTKEARQYVEALGIQIDKSKSIGEQIVPVIEQYRHALELLTPVQQQEVLNQIFGQDAIRAASILFTQQKGALRDLTAEFERNNSLQALSDAKAKGLKGAFANLQNQLETLGLNVGGLTTGPLTDLVNELANGVEEANKFADAIRELSRDVKNIDLPDVKIPLKFTVFGREVGGTVSPIKEIADFAANIAKQTFDAIKLKAEEGFLNIGFPGAGNFFLEIKPRIIDLYDRIAGVAEQEARKAQERMAAATAQMVQKGVVDETTKAIGVATGVAGIGLRPDESVTAAAKAAAEQPLTAEQRRARARIAALQAQQAQKALNQIPIPLRLQQAQIDAQLSNNLNAEVKADNAIINFIEARRAKLTEGTQKYVTVSNQLLQAQNDRDAVLREIATNQKDEQNKQDQLTKDAASALKQRLQNQQARLEIAAEAAGPASAAEQKLIDFLAKEARDARLETSEQLAFARDLQTEKQKQRQAITQIAQDEIDRRKALLDLRIQQAGLTPQISDDKKAIQNEINFLRNLQSQTKVLSKEWIAYESEITSLKQRIQGLSNQGGGFTLGQLFQEAASEFKTFASNIADTASGVLSGQDARAAFSQIVLKDSASTIQRQQLSTQQRMADLLAALLSAVSGGGRAVNGPPNATGGVRNQGSNGSLTAAEIAKLAASYGFQVN